MARACCGDSTMRQRVGAGGALLVVLAAFLTREQARALSNGVAKLPGMPAFAVWYEQ